MSDSGIFISSLTRRQLARRRPTRGALPLQLIVTLLVVASALGAFVAGRGGF